MGNLLAEKGVCGKFLTLREFDSHYAPYGCIRLRIGRIDNQSVVFPDSERLYELAREACGCTIEIVRRGENYVLLHVSAYLRDKHHRYRLQALIGALEREVLSAPSRPALARESLQVQ